MFLGVLDRYFNMLSREFFRFWKFSFFVISEPKNYPPQKKLSQLFTFVINVIFPHWARTARLDHLTGRRVHQRVGPPEIWNPEKHENNKSTPLKENGCYPFWRRTSARVMMWRSAMVRQIDCRGPRFSRPRPGNSPKMKTWNPSRISERY